jgi:hypothetical protein
MCFTFHLYFLEVTCIKSDVPKALRCKRIDTID